MSIKIHAKKCIYRYAKNSNCDCDGYHTFDELYELYEHRVALFILLLRSNIEFAWRSRKHSDGTSIDGFFIAGLKKEKGEQITYHLPNKRWRKLFMIETLENAPEFDGHTSDDVINRLYNFKRYYQSTGNKKKSNSKKFEMFWEKYPRKEGKKPARERWNKIDMSEDLFVKIMNAIDEQKKSKQWREGFIPHAKTWLNQERWEDIMGDELATKKYTVCIEGNIFKGTKEQIYAQVSEEFHHLIPRQLSQQNI